MTTTEIQTSLAALQTRRTALAAQLAAQRESVATAQTGLIAGTSNPADVAHARGQESALQSALDALDGHVRDTQTQLSQSHAADAHANKIWSAIQIAQQGEADKAEFDAAVAAAATALQTALTTMLATSDRLVAGRAEFERLVPNSSVMSADLALVKASADPSAILSWGHRRAEAFNLESPVLFDVEAAYDRAWRMRDQESAKARSRGVQSPYAEPGATT